jgi:hypothetical protein
MDILTGIVVVVVLVVAQSIKRSGILGFVNAATVHDVLAIIIVASRTAAAKTKRPWCIPRVVRSFWFMLVGAVLLLSVKWANVKVSAM